MKNVKDIVRKIKIVYLRGSKVASSCCLDENGGRIWLF